MAVHAAALMCPFIVTSDIFTLKKDTSETHYNNVGFNVPDNAPLVVYHATLVGHWLVMGLKTDSSHVDMRLSKMEAAIESCWQPCSQLDDGARSDHDCQSQVVSA
jgi:hypothetical protein